MFTFETARLDGGGKFTRKEKLFKRVSHRGPAWRGQNGGGGGQSTGGGAGGRAAGTTSLSLSFPVGTTGGCIFKGPSSGDIRRVRSGHL